MNLRAFLAVVFDIVRLKGGPENLPASTSLLTIVVAVFAALTSLVLAHVATPEQAQRWPVEIVVGIAGTMLFFRWVLHLAKKSERFVQTMTALFAVRTVFTPVVLPMAAAVHGQLEASQSAPAALALIAAALGIWLLVVEVRIIRSAFEWPTAGALGLVMAQNFVVLVVFALALAALGVKPT
ncbi:MAG TPA: hypothetical protein VMF52_13355 [Steroidobacteraceae bacterium]|nr:hypothetical protein [Steroidobacteraceae bacterium]